MDPIGIVIRLSEIRPIMNVVQAEREEEISGTIQRLSVLKLAAAGRDDRNKFNLICKQQTQAAMQGADLIAEIISKLQ